MRIAKVLASPGLTGSYADDHEAVSHDRGRHRVACTGSPIKKCEVIEALGATFNLSEPGGWLTFEPHPVLPHYR